MTPGRLFLPALASLLCASSPLDNAHGPLLRAFPTHLRWDNVERLPEWCGEARLSKRGGLHVLRLEEGQALFLPMEAEGWLRVRPVSSEARKRLAVGFTDGSGLSAALPDRGDPKGSDALFGPAQDQASLFRLACPKDGRGPVEVALFTSRTVSAGPLPPYLEAVSFTDVRHGLSRPGDLQIERWEALAPGGPVSAEVEGPARLALDLRLRAGGVQSRDGLRFRLRWGLDEAPDVEEAIRTAVEVHEPLLLDGRPGRLGRRETRWIDVPAGRHRLRLASDQPLLFRLHREGPGNYLLPALNLPRPWIPGVPPAGAEPDSARLARITAAALDPRVAESGLAGLALFDQWLRERPGDEALRERRQRAAAEWTAFRTLLPTDLPPGALTPAFAWLPGAPQDPRIPVRKAGAPADLEQALAGLSQATFHTLASETVYHLEPRSASTELRLLVDRASPGGRRLQIQFDERAPVTLDWEAPAPAPADWRVPTVADLGLALAAQDRGWRAQPLLQGHERAPLLPPLPLVEAGALCLPLPPEIRTVRIRLEGPAPAPLSVALQILASRSLEAPSRGPALKEPAAIEAFLARSEAGDPEALLWLPLRRWLRAEVRAFEARVHLDSLMAGTLEGRSEADAESRVERARALDAADRRVAAVQAWAEAFRAASGTLRIQALQGFHRALRRAGEPFLAEQWAKAAFLRGEPQLRESAFELLERQYQEGGSRASRLAILAVAAHQQPTPRRLVALAGALLEDGQTQQSLRVLTLMPPEAAPELWVRAGRSVRSEEAVAAGLQAWGRTEGRRLWDGILLLDRGLEAEAAAAWDESGATGEPWRRAREAALDLAPRLAADPSDPALLAAWNTWADRHPGPWSWRSEPWLVKEAAGSAQLRNIEQDQTRPVFRAAPGRPVRLSVMGPVRLRMETYPLHPAGEEQGLQGALEIRGNGWIRAVPFARNWPAPGLQVEGRPGERPGQQVACELDLPAGLHELEIAAGGLPCLVAPTALRPEVPLGPLPQRAPEALTAMGAAPSASPAATVWVPTSGLYLAGKEGYAKVDPEVLRRRLLAPLPAALSWPRGQAPADSRPLGEGAEALCAAADPDPADASAVAARLDALAWQALSSPQAQQACLAAAERLVSACPEAELHTDALGLLRTGALWTPAGTTASGAGLRVLSDDGRQPFSPSARVRQSLLPAPGDRILSGQEALVYQFQQSSPWTLRLEAAPFVPSLSRPQPVVLRLTLDGEVQRWVFDAEAGASTKDLPLPAGKHTLRLELEHPYEGQWIRLRFPGGLGQGKLELPGRVFEVGRRGAPLRLKAEGPLWVRADRWNGEAAEPEYRYLPPGPQEWILEPPPGESEILCAFSYQEVVPGHLAPLPRPWSLLVQAVPRGERVPADPQGPRGLVDTYFLGGQEDGTHHVRFRAFSRRDPVRIGEPSTTQRGLEAAFGHGFLDPVSGRYWEGEAQLRRLEGSGLSFNLGGYGEQPIFMRPLMVFAQADLIFQRGAGPGLSSAQASAADLEGGLRLTLDLGRRTGHTAELSAYYRHLDLPVLDTASMRKLDLDLWSPFRERNRWGFKASETLRHRPWQDTLWTLKASAMLTHPRGEALSLAVTALQAEWRQRLGAFEARLEGGASRYGWGALATAPFTRAHALAAVEAGFWTARQNLWKVSAEIRRDFEPGVWTGALSLIWHFGHGRGDRDLRRGSRAFPRFDGRTLSTREDNGWKDLLP